VTIALNITLRTCVWVCVYIMWGGENVYIIFYVYESYILCAQCLRNVVTFFSTVMLLPLGTYTNPSIHPYIASNTYFTVYLYYIQQSDCFKCKHSLSRQHFKCFWKFFFFYIPTVLITQLFWKHYIFSCFNFFWTRFKFNFYILNENFEISNIPLPDIYV